MQNCFLAIFFCSAILSAEPSANPGPAVNLANENNLLDGASTVAFVPLASPTAAKHLLEYFHGFFSEDDKARVVEVPNRAKRIVQSLAGLQKSGASHVVIYYHEGKGDVEYVRVIALGAFSAKANKPAPDDLIQQYGQGYATLGTWKDAEEVAVDAALPPLPIDKLTALARQLATTTDCSLDIIPLNQQAHVRLDSALHDAFAEEGQAPALAVVPAGAVKLKDSLHYLPPLGATHLIVTSFQNARGADVVNVSAKGVFTAEAQAKAKILLAAKMVGETSVLLGHYIDGEEAGLPKTETSKTERRAERKAGK